MERENTNPCPGFWQLNRRLCSLTCPKSKARVEIHSQQRVSPREAAGFWRVPSEMSMIERPEVDRDLILSLLSSRGHCPSNNQVSSWSGVLHLLGPCGIAGRLVVFAPVWPGGPVGGSPQAFGPTQVGDCTQNGGHPAAREPPSLLNKTLLPPGLGSHQKVGASRSGSGGLLRPQPLRHCPHSGNQTK